MLKPSDKSVVLLRTERSLFSAFREKNGYCKHFDVRRPI